MLYRGGRRWESGLQRETFRGFFHFGFFICRRGWTLSHRRSRCRGLKLLQQEERQQQHWTVISQIPRSDATITASKRQEMTFYLPGRWCKVCRSSRWGADTVNLALLLHIQHWKKKKIFFLDFKRQKTHAFTLRPKCKRMFWVQHCLQETNWVLWRCFFCTVGCKVKEGLAASCYMCEESDLLLRGRSWNGGSHETSRKRIQSLVRAHWFLR